MYLENKETKSLLDTYISKLLQQRVGNILALLTFLFLLIGVIDYLYRSGNSNMPAIYLLLSSPLLAILYLLNRRRLDKSYQHTILIIAATLSAISIELMILSSGGHKSIYFTGMALIAVVLLGFVPLSLKLSLAIISIYSPHS